MDDSPPIEMSFDYRAPDLLDVSADQFSVGGHRVADDRDAGVFDVVVGDRFRVGGKDLVPVVRIVDPSPKMGRIQLVANAVADGF